MSERLAHITPIRGVNDEGKGKKHALHRLIHAAVEDILWLHDDDVLLPEATDDEVVRAMQDTDLLILTLRMTAPHNTLIERLQVIEYAALQQLTVRTAQRGRAIMCSGANMLVRRDVWLEAEPAIHPEIPSGDDMFLLEYCKRSGKRIRVKDNPRFAATIEALPTLRALMRQRSRWAGKAPRFTDSDIRRYGAIVTMAMLLQILFPPVVLLYLPFEWQLARTGNWLDILLLALVYPYYAMTALLMGLNKHTW